jgi:uncharacterized protein DUF3455
MKILRENKAQLCRCVVILVACGMCFRLALAQDATQPPAGQKAVLTVKGDGVQIYSCKEADGAVKWVFVGPEAKLLDASGKEVGSHGAGPFWKSVDGSLVKGQLAAKQDAPGGAGDIPWLLAKASAHEGDGVLAKVEYIRRSDTHGGVAPSGGCDAEHLNANARVPYTATYTFYARKP